jgi:hypothetical protein
MKKEEKLRERSCVLCCEEGLEIGFAKDTSAQKGIADTVN